MSQSREPLVDIDVDINFDKDSNLATSPPGSPALDVDCSELSTDEELALAEHLTGFLSGRAVALVNNGKIVFDIISGSQLDAGEVETAVRDFIGRRNDSHLYSVERAGDSIVVHPPDPIASSRMRRPATMPPNVYQCPFCGFVTPYKEVYQTHSVIHYFR